MVEKSSKLIPALAVMSMMSDVTWLNARLAHKEKVEVLYVRRYMTSILLNAVIEFWIQICTHVLRFWKSNIGDSRIFASDFFILTSVTSDTAWGQSMSLSNLQEVSNFSWRCQLSYEVLFVEFGWKLKHPETAISHRALLDHPRLLNWPKSPHCLGLRPSEKLSVGYYLLLVN